MVIFRPAAFMAMNWGTVIWVSAVWESLGVMASL